MPSVREPWPEIWMLGATIVSVIVAELVIDPHVPVIVSV
jgi:hypothetical protein